MPMFATGPEFRRLNLAGAAPGEVGYLQEDGGGNDQTVQQGDVVAFFTAVHGIINSAAFVELDDEAQVLLNGRSSSSYTLLNAVSFKPVET